MRRRWHGLLALALLAFDAFDASFVGAKESSRSSRPSRLVARASVWQMGGLTGPGARELTAEFRRCYRENPFPEKLSLFFPDAERIIGTFYEQNYSSPDFLGTVDRVFRQLHAWPSAWPVLEQLLDLEHPWSRPYCEQVIATGEWSPFDFVSVSLETLRPLQRYPLSELRAQSLTGFKVLDRWLRALEHEEHDDPETRRLLQAFKAQDEVNAAEQVMRLRPLEDLLEYQLFRVLAQVFRACDATGSEAMTAIVTARDARQRTILHVAAEQGTSRLAELFLNAVTPSDRSFFAQATDYGGYTAEDLARLAGFTETAKKIRELGGEAKSVAPAEAWKLFPQEEGGQSLPKDSGGWKEDETGVPAEWLGDGRTEIDSISASQFEWETFEKHYVAPRRPLLIKGGVRMSVSDRRKFTREGLVEVAGSRKVTAYATPYENDFREVQAVEMSVEDYASFLDHRLDDLQEPNLSYVFERLPEDEGPLGFARSPPKLLADHVKLRSAQFVWGGSLMGSPLHHHVDAVNSLLYGRKLWFLKPPAQQEFRKTVVYQDLMKGGPQGLRVMQQGGDLLYVPQDWAHGALCLNQCIGLAHEFDVKSQTSPVPVETVTAGLGVAAAGVAFFSAAIIYWLVTHV
ncbi:unnamed protein product [Effrenium voratum]|uniref:JmjC domain-containing protein n=1 Tax=Effrenium voratum TaxID=2562239 RepID=A0AA36HNY4_9DINO|nr:unnamed protein product [Effrenium voratum]CAJ1459657.1 unnamed protein product [Effrenium voratum]